MVDVEAYQTEGSKDFNEFSCGSCGTLYDTEEEAEKCCLKEEAPEWEGLEKRELSEAEEYFLNDDEREAKADRDLDEHFAEKKKNGVE